MKCPFNVRIEQIEQKIPEYNDDGFIISEIIKIVEIVIPNDCLLSECAMYQNGRCARKN